MSFFGSGQKPATGATSSLFGTSSTPTTGSLFGSSTSNVTGGSLFGSPAPATGSLFGSATPTANSGSLFGTPAAKTGTSLFGTPPVANSGGSLFGSTSTPASGTSLFGSAGTTSTGGGSLFGSATTTSTAGGSLFGSATTTSTAGSSLFGSTATASTAGSSLFGSATTTSTAGSSLFGSTTVTPAAGSSLFGTTTGTPATGGSLFGSTPGTGGSLFGASNTTSTGTLFGSSAKPASGSLFGSTGNTSLFGTTPGTTNSLFSGSTAVLPTTDTKVERPKDENPLEGEVPKPLVDQFEMLSKKLKENQNLITEYSLNSAEKCLQIDGKLESLRIMMDEERKNVGEFKNKFTTLKESSHKDYLMAEMVHKLQASLDNGTTSGAQECRNYIMSLVNEYSQCIHKYNERIDEIYRLIEDELSNNKERRITEDELYENLNKFDQHMKSLAFQISQMEDDMQSIKILFMDNQKQKYGRFVQNPFDF
ncbi:Nucleoporin FG repeat-containing protein [Strongyloides ratti]|uniref:Nucleoporin FG repeat-containing protein n=1 Tax=Strongyloides ratti TaxID=34506 RepID=A0A090L8R7_STRRB|nr:Nucleoporin FG repeat-containing protein [Strongyloides ratti]CEF64533.1 Nucleoporin FG repeat-containing protein [Strongyloides ratti]